MKGLLAAASAAVLLAGVPARAQTGALPATPNASLSEQDRQFMNDAATGGMAEVELGQLALQKSKNLSVREFGRWMATDHALANNQLKQVAQGLGVQLPNQIDAEHQKMRDHLVQLSGTQFDRQYMQLMLEDHEKDVPQFEKMARSAQAPALKAFAQQVTPVLEQHLAEAQELNSAKLAATTRHVTPSAGSSMDNSATPRVLKPSNSATGD
jgi:putative membrane protein